ncbi:MAG: cofactor-independent phosphoglycerate mutase [Thermodesulfobacteriota bacterium]|nr:cofactor-independent phosphoglycerate mutase [Thermodesulfobacteriota bacterium]
MKYVLVQADGMPDRPIAEIDNQTPLEFANTPFIDELAKDAIIGTVNHIPKGFDSGSDVGNLSVLGYNPKDFFTGRSPLEASSLGLELGSTDITYRCNLVLISKNKENEIMEDYSAGHIKDSVAKKLIDFLKESINDEIFELFSGVSYRHILVWKGGSLSPITVPPHDITGKNIKNFKPKGPESEKLIKIMQKAKIKIQEFKKSNIEYKDLPCNNIWLWGQGKKTILPSFESINKITGSIISAVDLVKGIGKCAGLDVINVDGATGYLDTNYKGKVEAVLSSLTKHDFSMIHIEAPDETGHEGDVRKKIKAVEDLDEKVISPLIKGLKEKFKEFKICIVSDHPTPIELRTHSYEYVPFMIYDSRKSINNHKETKFNEKNANQANLKIDEGHTLLTTFLSD